MRPDHDPDPLKPRKPGRDSGRQRSIFEGPALSSGQSQPWGSSARRQPAGILAAFGAQLTPHSPDSEGCNGALVEMPRGQ
jgi:hypothetical protein